MRTRSTRINEFPNPWIPCRTLGFFEAILTRDEFKAVLFPSTVQPIRRSGSRDQCTNPDVGVDDNAHQARFPNRSARTSVRAWSIAASISVCGTFALRGFVSTVGTGPIKSFVPVYDYNTDPPN